MSEPEYYKPCTMIIDWDHLKAVEIRSRVKTIEHAERQLAKLNPEFLNKVWYVDAQNKKHKLQILIR